MHWPNHKFVKHTMSAIGAGVVVFLAGAEKITTNPWAQLGCLAGLTILVGLGIGVAKRSAP